MVISAASRNAQAAGAAAPFNTVQVFDLAPPPLAGNATFTGPVIDLGAQPGFARWRVFLFADQAGSCTLQQSSDGAAFYPTQVNAYTAAGGQAAVYESLIASRYLQVTYVNGAAGQVQFRLLAALVAI